MQDLRKSSAYQQWRREVRQRDENTCRMCGVKHNLHIHHIKPLEKYPELATELDNGLTLCGNCHNLLNGKEETTNLEQFIKSFPHPRDDEIVERLKEMLIKQLKTLNGIFSDSLRWMLEASDEYKKYGVIDKLLIQLETYPDSLHEFRDLIEGIIHSPNFTNEYKQDTVEFLERHSSGEASEILYNYKEQQIKLKRSKAEKLRQDAEKKWQQETQKIEELKQAAKEKLQQAIQEAENITLEADSEEKQLQSGQGTSEIPFNQDQLSLIQLNRHPMNQHAKMLLKDVLPDRVAATGLYALQLLHWAENQTKQRKDLQSISVLSDLKKMPPRQAMQRLLGEHFLPASTRRLEIKKHVEMFLNEDNTWQAVGILRKLLKMQARRYPW